MQEKVIVVEHFTCQCATCDSSKATTWEADEAGLDVSKPLEIWIRCSGAAGVTSYYLPVPMLEPGMNCVSSLLGMIAVSSQPYQILRMVDFVLNGI